MNDGEAFRLPDLFGSRVITLTAPEGQTFLRVDIGQPYLLDGIFYVCFNVWGLDGLRSKGVSTGDDALEALLRAVELTEAIVANICRHNGCVPSWRDKPGAGLPKLDFSSPPAPAADSAGRIR
jgi:hypothetical protein